ncbi:MAG: ribulose-phosphate 3-epimerase [Clostridiales bacterium]|nr:ribulose-phosphate 3-epimerase [Clostridiales bacterium]
MTKIKIAPSILSANFSRMGEEIAKITENGADFIHLDVMDGSFVRNISFGPKLIKESRPYSKAVFDAHLMIVNPWNYIPQFADAGADIITVHYEACGDKLKETLKMIKDLGVKCGAVINPNTEVDKIANVIEDIDMLLLMSVYPGFGGQKFIPEVLPKIEQARKLIESTGKDIDLEIDGGITKENVRAVKDAGANVIVAGSTVFNEPDRASVIKYLREI